MVSSYNRNMRKEKIINFIVSVFIPIILGTFVGLLFKDDFDYIESLNRVIKVPTIVFPIVWSILYLLQGIWYFLYLKKERNQNIIAIYWASVLVNLLFTPILFSFHLNLLATIIVITLLALIGYLFYYSLKKDYKFGYFYVPYLLWLIVALSLMVDILIHN